MASVVRNEYSSGVSIRVGAGGTGPPPPSPPSGGAGGAPGGGAGGVLQCHLLQPFLLYWQSVLLDERGAVRCDLEVHLVSLKAVGWDSLISRGLTVLCSFPEEVGLVYPPYCYSGLAT